MTARGCVRLHLNPGVQEREIKRGRRWKENTVAEKKSSGGRGGKNRIKSTGATGWKSNGSTARGNSFTIRARG